MAVAWLPEAERSAVERSSGGAYVAAVALDAAEAEAASEDGSYDEELVAEAVEDGCVSSCWSDRFSLTLF